MKEEMRVSVEKKSVVMVAAAGFGLFLLIHYWTFIAGLAGTLVQGVLPLVLGFALAYLVNIVMSFYERHLPRRKKAKSTAARQTVSLVLALLTILLVFAAVIVLVVPQFVRCVTTLINEAPAAIDRLMATPEIASLIPENVGETLTGLDWDALYEKAAQVLQSGASGAMQKISSGMSSLVAVFLSFVFALYFLSGKNTLKRQASRLVRCYVKPERASRLHHVLTVLDESFHRYVVAQCTEAVILGGLCVLGMLLLGLPYAEMIGTLIGVCSLIPVAGAYIGALAGAFMILSVSAEQAVIFLVFLVILQQLEGNLIYPRVVGNSVGLPGIWVLAAVSVGGVLMGVLGMLLSVPLASAAYRLLREELQRREKA